MCETIEVNSPEELKKLIDEIPEGTVYSLQMEVVLTNEQGDGKSEGDTGREHQDGQRTVPVQRNACQHATGCDGSHRQGIFDL